MDCEMLNLPNSTYVYVNSETANFLYRHPDKNNKRRFLVLLVALFS